jgi:hypothetical protein
MSLYATDLGYIGADMRVMRTLNEYLREASVQWREKIAAELCREAYPAKVTGVDVESIDIHLALEDNNIPFLQLRWLEQRRGGSRGEVNERDNPECTRIFEFVWRAVRAHARTIQCFGVCEAYKIIDVHRRHLEDFCANAILEMSDDLTMDYLIRNGVNILSDAVQIGIHNMSDEALEAYARALLSTETSELIDDLLEQYVPPYRHYNCYTEYVLIHLAHAPHSCAAALESVCM